MSWHRWVIAVLMALTLVGPVTVWAQPTPSVPPSPAPDSNRQGVPAPGTGMGQGTGPGTGQGTGMGMGRGTGPGTGQGSGMRQSGEGRMHEQMQRMQALEHELDRVKAELAGLRGEIQSIRRLLEGTK